MTPSLILGLIKSGLDAWRVKMELSKYTYYYDIEEKHEARLTKLRNEIEKLRNRNTVADTDAADKLRLEFKREQDRWEHISAAYFTG